MDPVTTFDLAIVRKGQRYRVCVLSEAFGWPETEVSVRRVAKALADGSAGLSTKTEGASPGWELPTRTEVAKLGEWLFNTFFTGEVRAAWDQCFRSGQGVCLRLLLDDAPSLSSLPWETLCTERGFVALEERTTIVRSLKGVGVARSRQLQSPARVHFLEAQAPGSPTLTTHSEWVEVSRALSRKGSGPRFQLHRASYPLSMGKSDPLADSVQIVHFAGHGAFDRHLNVGVTLHAASEEEEDYRLPQEWRTDLAHHEALRLVVLNCCVGARHGASSVHTSLAHSFVRSGVPAVVAMQSPISDEAAVAFSRGFYSALAAGDDMAVALTRARQEIRKVAPEEWPSPVMYLREALPPLPGHWRSAIRWGKSHGKEVALCLLGLAVLLVVGRRSDVIAELWWRGERRASEPRASRMDFFPPFDAALRCPTLPGTGIEFVLIPAGEFQMGSESGEENERPVHDVHLSQPLCFAKTELTQQQWWRVKGSNPSRQKGDDLPVTDVSWFEAQGFVSEINLRNPGVSCSLPSEAQFEYAAGVGSGLAYGFRGSDDLVRFYGNCGGEGDHDGYRMLAPVKEFKPNEWGIYEMVGNASEWVLDRNSRYSPEPAVDPTGPAQGEDRVRRGGSYRNLAKNCRASSRASLGPDRRLPHVGFRIVCTPLTKPLP